MRGEIIKIPRNSTLYIFPFLLLLLIFRHFNDHPQSDKGLRTCCEIINLLYTFFTYVQSEFEKKEERKEGKMYWRFVSDPKSSVSSAKARYPLAPIPTPFSS